tara:strand:+ start:831 stop:1874 length:1044 start_codon:yes stop_codon:yes gene_type:complete
MANYTGVNKSTTYFNTKLYTGNGNANHGITGVGFQPDWVWIKNRTSTYWNQKYDVIRGVNKSIASNSNNAQENRTDNLNSFDTDGFTVGAEGGDKNVNYSGDNYVAWNWKAGGSGSSNSNGSVTSTVSANTTAGFSICKFSFPGSGNFTVGHGLGVAPDVVLMKGLGTANWQMYHSALGNTKNIQLNYSAASSSAANWWNSTSPTSTVFSVGSDLIESGQDAIAYCFAAKQGYSRFGKWIGNGNADGTFIYTGFAPKWLLLKKDGGDGWWLIDDKMANVLPNPNTRMLVANTNGADNSSVSPFIDIYSNGFKLRSNWSGINADGSDYIYLAIGQTIVGTNNVAAVAR